MSYGFFGPMAVGRTNFAAPFVASADCGTNFASPFFARAEWNNLAMPYAAWGAGGQSFAGVPYAGLGALGSYGY